MNGDQPISRHVFTVTPYGALVWRRWRWRCRCGAEASGYVTKASAVFAGDGHAMRA